MKLFKRTLATSQPWSPPRPANFVPQQPSTLLKNTSTPTLFNEDAIIRNNWSKPEIQLIYNSPLLDLVYNAAKVHRIHHNSRMVQQCTLLSIKTGGCTEDCAYWYVL